MSSVQKCRSVYCCLHWKDADLWWELKDHLSVLVRLGYIIITSDLDILPGSDLWQARIKLANEADIILLLFSHHFMADDYCYAIARQSLIRYHTGEAQVVLVMLSSVHYTGLLVDSLPRLPLTRHITGWPDINEAFVEVVKGIREI